MTYNFQNMFPQPITAVPSYTSTLIYHNAIYHTHHSHKIPKIITSEKINIFTCTMCRPATGVWYQSPISDQTLKMVRCYSDIWPQISETEWLLNGPKWLLNCPIMIQIWSQMISKRFKWLLNGHKLLSNCVNLPRNGPKWLLNDPKWLRNDPKLLQNGPIYLPNGPKWRKRIFLVGYF